MTTSTPPLHGATLRTTPPTWYAWNDRARDDRGLLTGGPDVVRLGFPGKLGPFCAACGLAEPVALEEEPGGARQGQPIWRSLGGRWSVEVVLDDVLPLAVGLERAGLTALASALLALLPHWTLEAEEEALAEREAEAAENKAAEALAATVGADTLDELRHAEEVTRRLQRMARSKVRGDDDYYLECLPIVVRLLRAGVQPGLDEGRVTAWDGPDEGETLVSWCWLPGLTDTQPDRLALYLGPGAGNVGDWTRTLQGVPHEHRGLPHIAFDARQTLRASRQIERRSLAAALTLRLALCTDSIEERRHDLALMASAGTIAEIPSAALRRYVRDIERSIPLPSGLAFRPYQLIGIAYAEARGFRAIIGDAMGLGKTLVGIGALIRGYAQMLPGLVVAPSSVLYHWYDDIKRFAPWLDPVVVEGTRTELPEVTPHRVYIVSWDNLHELQQDLLFEGVQSVIADEAHYAKNPQARRSQALASVARAVPHALLLTGTAIENRISELWHLLHIIDPDEFPSREDFKQRYSNLRLRAVERKGKRGRTETRVFLDDIGSDLHGELRHRLRHHMIRRRKTDVLADLPPKTRAVTWVRLPGAAMATYAKAEAKAAAYLYGVARERALAVAVAAFHAAVAEGQAPADAARQALAAGNAHPFNPSAAAQTVGPLWRFVGQAKAALALQWIVDRAAGTDTPLVVFVWHQPVLKALAEGLQKAGLRWTYIDGSVSAKKRGERVQGFQAGDFDVILLTKAGYQGITLTAASEMLFVEEWWNPAWIEQAEDRIHRIGQNDAVTITRMLARGTVDEHVYASNEAKRAEVTAVLGEEDTKIAEVEAKVEGDVVAGAMARFVARAEQRIGLDVVKDEEGAVVLVTPADLARGLRGG